MENLHQYHWRSRSMKSLTGGIALVLCVVPLAQLATTLGLGLLGVVAIWLLALWLVWRNVVANHRSGSWITPTRLVLYREDDQRSFDLATISHIRLERQNHKFVPLLHLKDGLTQRLPLSALPRLPELRDWLAPHGIALIDSRDPEMTLEPAT